MRLTAGGLFAVLGVAFALGGCGGSGDGEGGGRAAVRAVATTTEVGDLIRNVGGSRVAVRVLLPTGADPHGYEPRPSDVTAISRADVVFRSGGEVDDWLRDLADTAGGDVRVVDLIDAVHTLPGDRDEPDPHWWQDPSNGVLATSAIAQALSRADRAGAAEYRRNGAAYARRLRQVDRAIAACMGRIPKPERKLVTSHDSLGYLARRYGLELVGAVIPSLSTQAQPSARDVERLVQRIKRERVRAVLTESAVDPRLERAIAREAGASVGRRLWADSLGPRGSSGETYLKALASNAAALVEGMSGGRVSCRPRA